MQALMLQESTAQWVVPLVVQATNGGFEGKLVKAEPWSAGAAVVEPGKKTMYIIVDKTGVVPAHAVNNLELFTMIYSPQVRSDQFVVLCCDVPRS
jgi:hypothetical protein